MLTQLQIHFDSQYHWVQLVDESKDNISRLIENMTTCLLTGIIVKEEVAPTERFPG